MPDPHALTFLAAVSATLHSVGVGHGSSQGAGQVILAPWQWINLIGAPLLALLFLPTVVRDIEVWWGSLREEQSSER